MIKIIKTTYKALLNFLSMGLIQRLELNLVKAQEENSLLIKSHNDNILLINETEDQLIQLLEEYRAANNKNIQKINYLNGMLELYKDKISNLELKINMSYEQRCDSINEWLSRKTIEKFQTKKESDN